MTTNNEEERQEAEQQRDDAAIARDEAAIIRDELAHAREDTAIAREEAAIKRDEDNKRRNKVTHQHLREDIQNTQNMVTGTGEDVVFRVEGLQDKFFEHLIFATNAIEDATTALERERKTRKIQIISLSIAVVLGIVLGVITLLNTMHIEEQRKRSDEVACLAINENRNTIYEVLESLAARGGGIDAEEEELLKGFLEGSLLPLECDGGIVFVEDDPTTTP